MFSELSQPRFAMVLLGTFAGLAFVLTVVGLYGVMMYSVARRTREIGVRMALGARRGIVLKMVLRDAAVLLAIGIAVGVAASLISASVLQSMLYGTGSRNPLVLTLVCIAVALAGLIAAYIPAFRAASIEPMQALRANSCLPQKQYCRKGRSSRRQCRVADLAEVTAPPNLRTGRAPARWPVRWPRCETSARQQTVFFRDCYRGFRKTDVRSRT